MNDTGKEQKTVPAGGGPAEEETAANNNIEETAEEPAAAEELSPEARVAALEAELAEQRDRWLGALAETENVRRRGQREREDAAKYAVAGFAKELLSVADNLRRAPDRLPAEEAKDERTRSLLAGVEATERELLPVFERYGVRR